MPPFLPPGNYIKALSNNSVPDLIQHAAAMIGREHWDGCGLRCPLAVKGASLV